MDVQDFAQSALLLAIGELDANPTMAQATKFVTGIGELINKAATKQREKADCAHVAEDGTCTHPEKELLTPECHLDAFCPEDNPRRPRGNRRIS